MYLKDKLSYVDTLVPEIKEKILDIYNGVFLLAIEEDDESDLKLSNDLGELAVLITRSSINQEVKMKICTNLYSVFERANDVVRIKLKNFFEMLCVMDGFLIDWLINIQNTNKSGKLSNSESITEIIIASRIKRGEIDICEREVEFMIDNYKGYREISIYYLFMGNYIKSLYFINKALRNCPIIAKAQLELKRKEIIYRMEE